MTEGDLADRIQAQRMERGVEWRVEKGLGSDRACVVDQESDIETIRQALDLLEEIGSRDVDRSRPYVDLGLIPQLGGEVGQRARLACDQHEIQAALRELSCEARAHSLRAAYDDDPRSVAFLEHARSFKTRTTMTQSIIFFNASSTFDLVRDLVFLDGGGVWNVVILS